MARLLAISAFLLGMAILEPGQPLHAETMEARITQSREAVKSFGDRLRGELQAAMQAGGPVHAVEVCHTVAQEIAAEESRRRGWEIGRTSLKLRNPANAPDDWELETLRLFEAGKAAGQDPATLERHAEVTAPDGGRLFRYMKAIPTAEPCTACHGRAVAPEIRAVILDHYPEDQATGFAVGDLRGAFTIVQPLD
jgi:hypothetical protein